MKQKLNVLFAAFEAVPFMKTGGLGDVAGSLPRALRQAGCEARVILPKFGTIPQQYREQMAPIASFTLRLGWRELYCGIETLTHQGVPYYFVDNEFYFKREHIYGYGDDGERIAFFSKAVVEAIPYLPDFPCDVLHCNDWHTALAPVFLRELYQGAEYKRVKTVFTIHNIKFQGIFPDYTLGDVLGLDHIPAAVDQLRFDWQIISYMKGALCYSDVLTTVSPTYVEELKHPFYGERLDELFRQRADRLHGILNGIDTQFYNPDTDPELAAPYSAAHPEGKARCKTALRRELELEEDEAPVVAMIGRLTEQKGLDLVARVMDELVDSGLQMVVLGTGEKRYEDMLRHYGQKYPRRVYVGLRFDEGLSHRVYAGADMLLMPSLFEPCGLSQMIAMRYGTLPVVRETGGLRDSVIPYNRYTGEGTGFSFANYNAHEMMFTLLGAADLYRTHRERWQGLVANAMATDFGWERAAEQYLALYQHQCGQD